MAKDEKEKLGNKSNNQPQIVSICFLPCCQGGIKINAISLIIWGCLN